MKHTAAILARLVIAIQKELHILDFGCGAGRPACAKCGRCWVSASCITSDVGFGRNWRRLLVKLKLRPTTLVVVAVMDLS